MHARDRLRQLASSVNDVLNYYQINTPLRICHFIAQVAHESDCFNAMEEYASGEDYEGRDDLGNTQPGDGVRFKGRGLMQLTSRANYAEFSLGNESGFYRSTPTRRRYSVCDVGRRLVLAYPTAQRVCRSR
jgi:predicted chitinase